MDVMFYEVFKEEEAALKKILPKNVQAGFTFKTIQEYNVFRCPAALISVRTQSRIPTAWKKTLRGILTRSTGFDHIHTYFRQIRSNIPSGYLPDYCARAVAEHAVLVAWMLLKKLKQQEEQFETFKRDGITGFECQGKNLLVVGVGNIGRQVVQIARALKMNVQGADLKKGMGGLKYVSLAQGLRWADIVICALPLTASTRQMLNYKNLQRARRGFILVNISRGEISPIADLKRLLNEGILGGLSLDVYEEENGLAEYLRGHSRRLFPSAKAVLELRENNAVIFTPHNAFNTHETLERKARNSVEAVVTFLRERKFPHPVPAG